MEITKAKVIRKLKEVLGMHSRKSYSQLGEDLLLFGLLSIVNVKKPFYVDIGAHHAKKLSNTYFFYKRGANGILIEPDPDLYSSLKAARPRDINLNIGIGKEVVDSTEFYIMSAPTLNTFSKEDAENYDREGTYKIKKVIKLPLIPINSVFEEHVKQPIDFISLDVEGLDLEILQSIDFKRFRPKFFCVESIRIDSDHRSHKNEEMLNFMTSMGYFGVADTWLNTIFVDKEVWENRPADT